MRVGVCFFVDLQIWGVGELGKSVKQQSRHSVAALLICGFI